MILPDHAITHRALHEDMIVPYSPDQVQPASYDVRLHTDFMFPPHNEIIDLEKRRPEMRREQILDELWLNQGDLVLGCTVEHVDIPHDLVGRIEGKSSLARVGIQIHSAGYLDPGFHGPVTLEIVSFWPYPVKLWPGMLIAQLSFDLLTTRCSKPYGSKGLGSHYQNATTVEGTKYAL